MLIVDNDRDLASLLGQALRRFGHEVLVAENGEEAMAAVAATAPDLAVLDVRVQAPSGLELGAVLRDQFGVQLVFLVGLDDEQTVREATAAGALAYLVKPCDMRQWVPTIDAAIARAAELRRLRETEAHLSGALRQAREVSMAVGILMERFRLSREGAFERLRGEARARRQRMGELALELLESVERLNALGSALPASERRARSQARRDR